MNINEMPGTPFVVCLMCIKRCIYQETQKTRRKLAATSFIAVSGPLSYPSLLSSAGASVPSSSADIAMLQHIVAVCTVGYITLLCSQSA